MIARIGSESVAVCHVCPCVCTYVLSQRVSNKASQERTKRHGVLNLGDFRVQGARDLRLGILQP